MKRGLILSICFLLCISLFTSVYADIDDVPVADRINRFEDIGESGENVTEFVEDDEFIAQKKLLEYIGALDSGDEIEGNKMATRAFAARVVAGIMAGGCQEFGSLPFSDVTEKSEYANGIYTAYNLGIIDGTEKKFYPTEGITKDDFSKMLVKALSLDEFVENEAYFSYVHFLGIFKGIDLTKDKLTNREIIRAGINALHAETVEISAYANDGSILEVEEKSNKNYLYKRYKIVKLEGIVTGVGNASLYGDRTCGDNEIEINRMLFSTNEYVPQELFGNAVYAYVDKTENENKIVSIIKNAKKNHTYSVNNDELSEVSERRLSFYDENDEKATVHFENTARVIENNTPLGSIENVDIVDKIEKASCLTFIDNDGDDEADIIVLSNYVNYVVEKVSTNYETIVLKYGKGVLNLGENNTKYQLNMEGKSISFEELKPWDVLTVIQSENKNGEILFDIHVSRKIASGKLEEIDDDLYVIDGKQYKTSVAFEDFLKNNKTESKPSIGMDITCYLSDENEIVASETGIKYSFAYLMAVDYEGGSLLEKASVKLYSLEGVSQIYDFDDKVKVITPDKEKVVSNQKEIFELLVDQDTKEVNHMMLAYKLKNNVICELVLEKDNRREALGNDDYPIRMEHAVGGEGKESAENRVYTNLLKGEYNLQKTSIIFVPAKQYRNDERRYKTSVGVSARYGTEHYFKNEKLILYNSDRFYTPKIAVVETADDGSSDLDKYLTPVMIKSVSEAINSDGDAGRKISYFSAGREVSQFISPDAEKVESFLWFGTEGGLEDLAAGDVIQFTTNELGEMDVVRVLAKYKNLGQYRYQTVGKSVSKFGSLGALSLVYGKVIDVKDNVMLIDVSDDDSGEYVAPATISTVYGQNTYTILDTETMKVYSANKEDIMPGDEVILRERWYIVSDVFILK